MPTHVDYDMLTFPPEETGGVGKEVSPAAVSTVCRQKKSQSTRSKDLLELENNLTFEKRLLVCNNGELSFDSRHSKKRGPPTIVPVPQSSVLERMKSFLPALDSANRKLLSDIQERGGDEFNIELANEAERYVEMDLALGVADLHTPEAVAAAELVSSGQFLTLGQPGSSAESSSDSEGEQNSRENGMGGCLNFSGSTGTQQTSGSDHHSSSSQSKRKKIELL